MIQGNISATVYIDAQLLHRSPGLKRYLFGVLLALVGAVLFLLDKITWGSIFIGVGLGAIAGELGASKLFIPWKTRRLYQQHKDLASLFTYTWNEDCIEAKSDSGQTRRPWENYLKHKENEKLFLLYHADNMFEMFPKRWFKDEAQLSEFRRLLERVPET